MTKKKDGEKPSGRKSTYKKSYPDQAYKFALLGLIDAEMAPLFGVSTKTFGEWKKKHPELREAIAKGKEPADAEIADSLNQRAKGITYTEQQAIKVKEVIYENGKRVRETERIEVVPVERHIPPDTRAIQYWMNNRRRKRLPPVEGQPAEAATWADRHEVDHTTGGEKMPTPQVYYPAELTPDELGLTPPDASLPSQ